MTEATNPPGSIFDYQRPPVNEVVCGVMFEPMDGFLAPHVGLFWQECHADYPTCEERPPIAGVVELFGNRAATAQFSLSNVPPLPRMWLISTDGNWIIQIQRDRFLHNWRKVRNEDVYPRYSEIAAAFRQRLSAFRGFLAGAGIEPFTPMQYEMTYVNQIPKGEGWESLADLTKVLPDFQWRPRDARPDPFLPSPIGLNYRLQFDLPDETGRLHVVLGPGKRATDNHPSLNLELTVRGFPGDSSEDAMKAWFDQARNWIVRGFTDITAIEMQDEIWGREHDDASAE